LKDLIGFCWQWPSSSDHGYQTSKLTCKLMNFVHSILRVNSEANSILE